jgi:Extensin-like protein C-terminus
MRSISFAPWAHFGALARGVALFLVDSLVLVMLVGCGHWFELWRHDAEVECLQAGAVREGPGVTLITPIAGPGICGADFPLQVAALGGTSALGLADEARRDSGSLLGTPAAIAPPATLACPIVSALDAWVRDAVQPAAQRWFGEPVVEIKQISAYSCRSMNGERGAPISEHAFGNALDVAAFTLADGRKVTVRDGWRGAPKERGFLHDVQAAACRQFSTVLAPGSNAFHYDHIHVDLARHAGGGVICNPVVVLGDVAAGRRRAISRPPE